VKRTIILRRSPWLTLLLLLGLGVAVFAGAAFWRASRALRGAAQQLASESRIPFRFVQLDRRAPAGTDWMSSPAVFNDAAQFQGSLFLSGPTGLFEYRPSGQLAAQYRVGLELPPAPLAALATGRFAPSHQVQLLIATRGGGLVAFDGKTFRQMLPAPPADCNLTALLPLANGRLLLGTAKNGLLVYDGKSLSFFHPQLSRLPVTALAGRETDFWVGTLDRGVLHWHGGQVDAFSEANGLPDRQVLSLAVEGDRAYVGTPLGVEEFAGGRPYRVLAKGFIARSLLVRGPTLEVGTEDEGTLEVPLNSHPSGPGRALGVALPVPVRRFLTMDSRLYALGEDGLYALGARGSAWQRVIAKQSTLLTDRNISALAFDPQGRLWVGYFDRGLDILAPATGRITHVEDGHVFCVNRIVYDRDRNEALVATANSLALFDAAGRERQVLGRAQGLISDHITDVVVAPGGMVVATPAGITLVSASGMRSLYAFQGLVSNHVYALAASGGRLLVGTLGGLSILEGGEVLANFTSVNSGLPRNWITALAPVGRDWFVGTYGAGVLRFDANGQWETFDDATGPFEVNSNALLAADGRVYAGTRGRGLMIYDRADGRWTSFTGGLPSTNVTALAVHAGWVYVGTENGLVRIPEEGGALR
jgi:outer membrane protein assembly factor BamB